MIRRQSHRQRHRRRHRRVIAILLLAACGHQPPGPGAVPSGAPATIAIVGATLIDATGAPARPGMTVLVQGDRIVALGAEATVRVPPRARRVDARGKYLIPGLWDAHVHLTAVGETDLPLFVAHGVTGVRDMGGTWDVIQGWRGRIVSGRVVGPRVWTAGPVVESARWLAGVQSIPEGAALLQEHPRLGIATPEDARRVVDSLARLGVDYVKVRNAPRADAYRALLDEARRRGLQVVGHLPRGGIGLAGAVEAGQRTIEHIDVLTNELDSVSVSGRAALFARMATRGTWSVPTLVAEVARVYPPAAVAAVVADTLGLLDPRRRSLSPALLAFWRAQQQLDKYETPRDWGPVIARDLGYLREMHRAGVPIAAGTDCGVRLVYPGASLHDELALLVEHAGLTPMEALQAATRNVARVLGVADEMGTIEVGKRTDLVLVDADPLADIRNVQRIHAVVLRGRLLDRPVLDGFRARAVALGAR